MAYHAALPDSNHVLRHIPWQRLRKDEDDTVIGILGLAFEDRSSDGLSVTWVEYWNGRVTTPLLEATTTLRSTRSGSKARIGIGQVLKIKEVGHRHSLSLRIVHDPEANNAGHSLVKGLSLDEALLDDLANEAFQIVP